MEQQAQLILAVKLEQLELKELVVTAVKQSVVVGSSFVAGVASSLEMVELAEEERIGMEAFALVTSTINQTLVASLA